MCGIAGIISLDGVNSAQLYKMASVLKHRGPDDEGYIILHPNSNSNHFKGNDTVSELTALPHISEANFHSGNAVGLAHRRLSILDLTASGHQPMSYAGGKNFIVHNGEVYNYKELRDELSIAGHQFQSDTDTEVIMAAYSQWGTNCVQKFVGMWAFALYDNEKKVLFLSRDRFGIKPLYYSAVQEKIAFASEIKSLLTLDFVKPDADMQSVFEYISFGATSNPSANLFRSVNSLSPGHNMIINVTNLNIHVEKYYDLKKNVDEYKFPSDENKIDAYKNLLENSVELHLRSDVPVGSALSGGLDSSTLVALAAVKMSGKKFKTFTASYTEKDIDESDFARMVTSRIHNIEPHYAFPDSVNYWKDFEELIWHQDLPINSTSMFAQWEVMKSANQESIKVLLDGQGADESLGGYYNFAGVHLVELLKNFQWNRFFFERKKLKTNFTPNIDAAFARALYYFFPEPLQRTFRDKKRLGMHFISDKYKSELKYISVPKRGGRSFREQSLLSMQFGLQELLRYEDRNSMAFSIESRVPFLDHRLVEYSIALNNEWKIKNGWTKYILRKTAEPFLDEKVVWRKDKMGFLTPQKTWKSKSKKELMTFINETDFPDFLDKNYILKLCSSDISNAAHLSEFWKIISFLKWASVFKIKFN